MARVATRPDPGSRERLLQAGLTLAQRGGLKALTVRAVAAEAGANLGSFVYHFGSREAFVDELIERWYAPMFSQLQGLADHPADPLAALRAALLEFVGWVVQHRAFLAHLVGDAAAGETGARRFLATIDRRHPAVLLGLIAAAQASGGLRRAEPLHQLMFLLAALALPVLLTQFLAAREIAPAPFVGLLVPLAVAPERIAERLDWALRGLSPDR
ncbi:TetR family transcriptional regulator [Rubrivivax gelatinosus]|nr:TetR family transcriptional regulator [Rubrivivax gelatinosus]